MPSGEAIQVAQILGFPGNWKIPEDEFANDDHTKRSRWVQKSQTGGQNCWRNELKDCSTKLRENEMKDCLRLLGPQD